MSNNNTFDFDKKSSNYKQILELMDLMDPGIEFETEEQKQEYLEEIEKKMRSYIVDEGLSKMECEDYIKELGRQERNINYWIDNCNSEIERIQKRIENFKLYDSIIRKVQLDLLHDLSIRKLQTATFSFYIQKNSKAPLIINEGVDLEDIDSLPAKYVKYEPAVDFKKIREDAEAGKCSIATVGEKQEGIRYR